MALRSAPGSSGPAENSDEATKRVVSSDDQKRSKQSEAGEASPDLDLPRLELSPGRFKDTYSLNFDRPLGVGRNGTVVEAIHTSGVKRAVKLLPDTEASRLEIRCQIACQKAEIVDVIEVHRVLASDLDGLAEQFEPDAYVIVVVMELMAGGEIYFRVISDEGPMPEADVKQIALQMARALKEVHSRGITHRDVKPENILLREKAGTDVGLTDFGFATPRAPTGARCTLAYAAPEIIQYLLDTAVRQTESAPYTCACDCWSLGAVLYFCLSGSMPFECKGDNVLTAHLRDSILKGVYSFAAPEWKEISDEAVDVIQQLMDPRVETRLTAKELLEHPWLEVVVEQPPVDADQGLKCNEE
eukprot:m.437564 g.437564  ORF g.437564 m.437564 type:complete len:358 (-) comp18128_c0_seq1:151-1224(-)